MLASAMPSRDKIASKRKENQACLGYLEQKQFIQNRTESIVNRQSSIVNRQLKSMLVVVLMMLGGILCGYLLRKQRVRIQVQQLTTVLIWALLFLLGLNIGSNEQVINSLGSLGLEALLITVFATTGSLIAAWLLWKYVNRQAKGGQ